MSSLKIITPIKAIEKFAEKQTKNTEKIIRATVSDLKTRAPGWIADEVVKEYNVKKSDLSPKVRKGKRRIGSIKVKGTTISSIEIVYTGQRLGPQIFKMKPSKKPKSRITSSGKKIKAKPYRVSYEVLKGHRTTLDDPKVFLNGEGSDLIVWKRKGRERIPIQKVVTISLPEMIHNSRNADAIDSRLNKGAEERLKHNIQRFSK